MDRGITPVVAVVCLLAITVVGAAGVTMATVDAAGEPAPGATPSLSVSVSAHGQQVTVAHRGGQPIDMRAVTLRVHVDGEPLAHQPPVPYFAAPGFRGTPTGAFNSAGDTTLAPGDKATLQLASTNAPEIEPGDGVRVAVRRDGRVVAAATTIAA